MKKDKSFNEALSESDKILLDKAYKIEKVFYKKIIPILLVIGFLIIIGKQSIEVNNLKKSLHLRDSLYWDMYYSFQDSFEKESFLVTVTTYNATKGQCDDSPYATACNFKIDSINPFKHRYVGLSRDLLDEFYYGEKIILENCGKYSGEYIVADCGNKRLKRTVDILINRNMIGGKYRNVVLKHKYDK